MADTDDDQGVDDSTPDPETKPEPKAESPPGEAKAESPSGEAEPAAAPSEVKPGSELQPGGSQQRQVRNYLLDPPFQVQLAIYNCILALGFAGALVGVLHSKLSRLEQRMSYLPDVPNGVSDALEAAMSDSVYYMVILALIFVGASVSITIILTHRLVGPAYAFRRQINELSSGRYEARVHLRRHDAFVDVADDLNTLAETLQRERGGLASTGATLLEMDP